MGVPTIALYADPPSSICSTHPCHINAHASYDFELCSRSSSATTTSSSQKTVAGGLSCLFSGTLVQHVSSTSFSGCGEELGSLWHDRGEELSSSFQYSMSKYLGSSLIRDSSPVSIFQGLVSCCSSGVGASAKSPPTWISKEGRISWWRAATVKGLTLGDGADRKNKKETLLQWRWGRWREGEEVKKMNSIMRSKA